MNFCFGVVKSGTVLSLSLSLVSLLLGNLEVMELLEAKSLACLHSGSDFERHNDRVFFSLLVSYI